MQCNCIGVIYLACFKAVNANALQLHPKKKKTKKKKGFPLHPLIKKKNKKKKKNLLVVLVYARAREAV